MGEDWSLGAKAPTFTLFKKSTPEEEAQRDTFVDIIIYNRWSKAERRLYQRLKTERLAHQIETRKINDMNDISSALEGLSFIKKAQPICPEVDDLIGRLEQMKVLKSKSGD